MNGQWQYHLMPMPLKGIQSPWRRSAFIVVSKGGTVLLLYSDDEAHHEAKKELDGVSTSNDLITHAAFCPEEGSYLINSFCQANRSPDRTTFLAVHTASKQVRLYSLRVQWPTQKPQGDQHLPPATLALEHLTSINVCAPFSVPLSGQFDAYGSIGPPFELTHLDYIAPLPDPLDKGRLSKPRILAAFTPVLDYRTSDVHSLGQTIITMWDISEEAPHLDESFLELNSKKRVASALKMEYYLRPLEDVTVDRIVTHIAQVQPGLTLGVCFCDGTIQFRDRSFASLAPDDSNEKCSSLSQAGFLLAAEPHIHCALSTNYCVAAAFGLDHDPKVTNAQLPFELVDPRALDKVAAAFALHLTAAEATANGQYADLLQAAQGFLRALPDAQRAPLERQAARDGYRGLFVADKLNGQVEIRMPSLTSCLAWQTHLADRGGGVPRSLQWKIGWITLNLKHAAISFGLSLKEPEISRPGKKSRGCCVFEQALTL